MDTFFDLDEFKPTATGSAVTIGIFDGLHLGHGKVIGETLNAAADGNLEPVLFTFSPGPWEFFTGRDAGHYLLTADEFRNDLASTGIARLVMIPFDASIKEMKASEFLQNVLLSKLNAKAMIVGDDFAFGVGKEGNVENMKPVAMEFGIELQTVSEFELDGVPVRSSNIRRLLREGKIETANRHLGYDFYITSDVVAGAGKGTELGSPTANLRWPKGKVKLPRGVYVVRALVKGETYPAVANFGVRPTFGNGAAEEILEVHLLDTDPGELHGETMKVGFVSFLREERIFSSVNELTDQIDKDIIQASEILNLDEAETERR